MVSELTVIMKDSDKTLRTKHLIYDPYAVHENDPVIRDCIEKTLKDFGCEPESIKVRINLEIE